MHATVEVHAIVTIPLYVDVLVEAPTEEDLISAAVVQAQRLYPTLTGFVRYIVERRPGLLFNDRSIELVTYHDRDHLEDLHEERLNEARVFDTLELESTVALTRPDAPEDTLKNHATH